MWDPVLERLAREREVIAVDMPGFGGSPTLDDRAPVTPRRARRRDRRRSSASTARTSRATRSAAGWRSSSRSPAARARSPRSRPPGCGRSRCCRSARPRGRSPAPLARSCRRCCAASAGAAPRSAGSDRAPGAGPVRRGAGARARLRGRAGLRGRQRRHAREPLHRPGRISVPLTLAWPEHDRLVARPRSRPAPARANSCCAGCGHMPTWDDPEQVAAVLLRGSGVARGGRAPRR